MTHTAKADRIGVFIPGACGDIAVTTIVEALAIRHRLANSLGMVSELDAFTGLELVSLDDCIAPTTLDQTHLLDDSSVLRGQEPVVE